MKSITFGIGYLLAVLVVDVSSADYSFFNVHKTTHHSPYNFGFFKVSDGLLIMEITLKNIPPSVTAVTAIQFTYNYHYDHSGPEKDTFEVNVDKTTREGKFMILAQLTLDQIWVNVQLHNGGGLCNETRITEGREINYYDGAYYWDTTQSAPLYYKYVNWKHDTSNSCLAPKTCEIILDLKDTCKEQTKSTYGDNDECHIKESQYICTLVRATTTYQDLKLYQTYEDNSVIGPVSKIIQKTTKLSIKLELELFDNNTSVKLASTRLRTGTTIWSDTLRITAQDISKASNVTILKYTETTDVQFSCEQYKHQSTQIHVGFINTTDNKITTHDTTIMKRNKFKMANNGTILCCIVYESTEKHTQEITITRFVKNKTLLIYQPQESTSTNLTESPSESSSTPSVIINVALVAGVALAAAVVSGLLVTLYFKTCHRGKPNTEETPQKETAHDPFYANLLFRKECEEEIQEREQHYEEIN